MRNKGKKRLQKKKKNKRASPAGDGSDRPSKRPRTSQSDSDDSETGKRKRGPESGGQDRRVRQKTAHRQPPAGADEDVRVQRALNAAEQALRDEEMREREQVARSAAEHRQSAISVQILKTNQSLAVGRLQAHYDPQATLVRDDMGEPLARPLVYVPPGTDERRRTVNRIMAMTSEELVTQLEAWRVPVDMLRNDKSGEHLNDVSSPPPELMRLEVLKRRRMLRTRGEGQLPQEERCDDWTDLGMQEDEGDEDQYPEFADDADDFCVMCHLMPASADCNLGNVHPIIRLSHFIDAKVGTMSDNALAAQVQSMYYSEVRPTIYPERYRVSWSRHAIITHIYQHDPSDETRELEARKGLAHIARTLVTQTVAENVSDPTQKMVLVDNVRAYMRAIDMMLKLKTRKRNKPIV